MTGLVRCWKSYWFPSSPLLSLAVCRIVLVGVQLVMLLKSYEPLRWIDEDRGYVGRLMALSDHPDSWYDPLPILRLLTLDSGVQPSEQLLIAVYFATLFAGLLAFVGLRTNLSLVVFAVGNVFLQSVLYSFGDWHHPETMILIGLSCLALSPAGAVLSIDDVLKSGRAAAFAMRDRVSTFARWPLLLMQWLIALMYLDAALNKLLYSGLDWMNGYTLQYFLFRDGVDRGSVIASWLAPHHFLAVSLSWVSIVIEATFISVLFFPRLARIYVPSGIGMHLGMCAVRIACFSQLMAVYCVFVPWSSVYECVRARVEARRRIGNPTALSRR